MVAACIKSLQKSYVCHLGVVGTVSSESQGNKFWLTVVKRNNYLSARISNWDIVPEYGTVTEEGQSSPIA